ncbi:hypothetical protein H6G74_23545 [Nostoc spongiaeforme FACHB-130]|uniref:Uncharacterized protein n=1 Tax=Nostoc spongiaeforme FACHB-130 TaxID=1357510 RepID=A0ABR8G211_9NOSO|nr:hypothetical protein [Nostoc spongiaeforme FACHB-130]
MALFAVGNQRGIMFSNAQWHTKNPTDYRYSVQNPCVEGILKVL